MRNYIDLRSDTVTQPSSTMRAAMAEAEVGDDVLGEDPTVNHLESVAAARLGKEAALFVPSGTMANLIAFLTQGRPGETILLNAHAHPVNYEGGNLARFAGLLARPLPGENGKITVSQLAEVFECRDDPHLSPMKLVSIENTTNRGGGACYSVDEVRALGAFCAENGLRLHCDGARLFNAAVALEVDASLLAAPCTTVSFCLSKGLGAPIGSLLTGDQATIHEARRCRKQLGGGMRQAGVAAAAGLHALAHHMDDLREDHRRAGAFRAALEAAGVEFLLPSPTNILFLRAPQAEHCQRALKDRGVLVFAVGPDALRVVFHRDISDDDLDIAVSHFVEILSC